MKTSHTTVQGWDVYHYATEDLRCITGEKYFLMVRKGIQTDRTAIWLDGGGACYPGRDDCEKEAQFRQSSIERQGLASQQENNPVRTWNFIYVPYCDGSLHFGDSSADYDRDGLVDHWHWGFKNTSAAVRLMAALFPGSQKILVAGCSAGGAGTMAAVPVVRLQFPAAKIYALNISGSGLLSPEKKEIPDIIKKTWGIEQFLPADCPLCSRQLTYFYSWLLDQDPTLKVGMFSSYHDKMPSTGQSMTPDEFEALLVSTTDTIRAEHSDTFRRFFIAGDGHCLSDYSYQVNDVSFWNWINDLINDDPGWVDILE
jgi:hypothetical protein